MLSYQELDVYQCSIQHDEDEGRPKRRNKTESLQGSRETQGILEAFAA